ncbi:cytochrome P450 71A8-like [Olea europaea subsp. europaea]|uniref:Cytochrome P450 71A8-like n=1 Tax=Olea europaea subsp. europaea TaxID=158383 RepID=A0A8S0U4W2_OLEEU|nr:cytochrome P450 71A8-like [Olea europaea subsp. europaea]
MAELLSQNPFIFIFIAIFPVWQFVKRVTDPTYSKNLSPSPSKLPIIGNLHQIGTLPHHSLHFMSKKYGPLMLLHFGNVPALIVSSAEASREIMKTYDVIFADRPVSSVSRRLLYDMKDLSVAPYGEYWRQLKSIFVLQLPSNKTILSLFPMPLLEHD